MVYTVCHSVCIVWTHYSMVEPYSSNFRVITTNFLGVRIFRKFTVFIPMNIHEHVHVVMHNSFIIVITMMLLLIYFC